MKRWKMEGKRWKGKDGREKMEGKRWEEKDGREKMGGKRWEGQEGGICVIVNESLSIKL